MDTKIKYHKKTILQVVPALNSGGVERGTLEVAKRIIEEGYRSIVVSSGGKMCPALENLGAEHIYMNVASKNPITIILNGYRLAKLIDEMKVDIVHARSRIPAWSCYIASKLTKVKFITTFHGVYNFTNGVKKFYNSIMTKGDYVIAVSNFVRNHIIENYSIDQGKLAVIHRGVDCDVFSPDRVSEDMLRAMREKYNIPKNTPVLLLPARMTRWKGQITLVEGIKQIRDLNFYCIIAGDLSKHPKFVVELLTTIEEHKLQNKVQLFGNESEMIGLYGVADIVLSTSIEPEAFGRTIIEAQAMNKIVIATSIGGACETIENNVTGFHVPPGDSKALAECLRVVLLRLQENNAQEIGERSRKSVMENFSLKKMLDKTIEVYSKF